MINHYDFNVGDYAEVVSGMFDGCHGYIYEVDHIGRNITLCGGVCVGFDRAHNLTTNPSLAVRVKGKKFKPNRYIEGADAWLPIWKQRVLWFLRFIDVHLGWLCVIFLILIMLLNILF